MSTSPPCWCTGWWCRQVNQFPQLLCLPSLNKVVNQSTVNKIVIFNCYCYVHQHGRHVFVIVFLRDKWKTRIRTSSRSTITIYMLICTRVLATVPAKIALISILCIRLGGQLHESFDASSNYCFLKMPCYSACNLYGLTPVLIRSCFLRSPCCANALSQCLHHGLTPE
jgi:hypothetical protein